MANLPTIEQRTAAHLCCSRIDDQGGLYPRAEVLNRTHQRSACR